MAKTSAERKALLYQNYIESNGYHPSNVNIVCQEYGYNPEAVQQLARDAQTLGILIHIGGIPFGAENPNTDWDCEDDCATDGSIGICTNVVQGTAKTGFVDTLNLEGLNKEQRISLITDMHNCGIVDQHGAQALMLRAMK